MIELSRGDWRLDVSPRVGASVARLTWRGHDILRPMPLGSSDVLQAGCFPLVPYANRIARGRFSFGGHDVTLPVMPNFAPHALHGDGWMAEWKSADGPGASVALTYRHAAEAWPWPYETRQTFTLADDALNIELSMTNTGDETMPAGLGLHPYFPVTDQTRLHLDAPEVWALTEGQIPTALHPARDVFNWKSGPRVIDAPFVDHCYVGWDGKARLVDPDRVVTISASPNARWAHVYAPGEGFVCVEPVTHRPDAVHAPEGEDSGLVTLAPDETLSMSLRIAVAAL